MGDHSPPSSVTYCQARSLDETLGFDVVVPYPGKRSQLLHQPGADHNPTVLQKQGFLEQAGVVVAETDRAPVPGLPTYGGIVRSVHVEHHVWIAHQIAVLLA